MAEFKPFPIVCRCGRRITDSWRCNHPERPPFWCRRGLHRWGIWTTPIMVRWCERCGQRDPETGDGSGLGAIFAALHRPAPVPVAAPDEDGRGDE